MVYAVVRSKEYLGDDYEPDLDGEFKPNVINSVVFLITAVQQVGCTNSKDILHQSNADSIPLPYTLKYASKASSTQPPCMKQGDCTQDQARAPKSIVAPPCSMVVM